MGILGLGKQNIKPTPQPGTQVEESEVGSVELPVRLSPGFDELFVNKRVVVRMKDGHEYRGEVLRTSNDWLLLRNLFGGNLIIIRRDAVSAILLE